VTGGGIGGLQAAQPVAVGAQVVGQLEAVAGVGFGLGRPPAGSGGVEAVGVDRDHGVAGGEQSVDHDPAGGLDGHRQVLGSAVAGRSVMAWSMPASLWASVQRSTSWPVSSITVTSCRWLAQSHPTCMSPPPLVGHPWFTARCRGPVAACSLFGPRSGISLKAVTGPRPVGGGGTPAGCQAARGIGRPPTVTEQCGHARTGRYQDGGPVSGSW